MIAIGITAEVMIVSGLRAMWRRERAVRVTVSLSTWLAIATPQAAGAPESLPGVVAPVRWRKICSRLGCLTTYSTRAGGS